jgi:hypothetical protein
VITTGGSYYLTTNLVGVTSQDGITVQADNVTLDLNGFSLTGVAGSHSGLVVSGAHNNLSVHNGVVQGWASKGIDAAGAGDSHFSDLRVANNAGGGMQLGSFDRASRCIVAGNGSVGVSVGTGSTVEGCTVCANVGDGIFVGSSCYVENNVCNTNTLAGIRVSGDNNRIDSNSLVANGTRGLLVQGTANLVIRNSASESAMQFDIGAGNNYGQILSNAGAGFTNSNPWANFAGPCLPGFAACGSLCANLASDGNNCSACGQACASSQQCVTSSCVCRSGLASCLGTCVNLLTDPHNCGTCGFSCTGSQVCSAGSCMPSCATGKTNCSHACVDLSSDPLNCGSCGNACPVNQNCVASACQ